MRALYWHPVSSEYLKGVTSNEIDALERVFGLYPITLDSGAIDKLNEMAATYSRHGANPYGLLVSAIFEFETIEVTTGVGYG